MKGNLNKNNEIENIFLLFKFQLIEICKRRGSFSQHQNKKTMLKLPPSLLEPSTQSHNLVRLSLAQECSDIVA